LINTMFGIDCLRFGDNVGIQFYRQVLV
jgi:hypothetical protein